MWPRGTGQRPGPGRELNLGGRDDLVAAVTKFTESVKAFGEVGVDGQYRLRTDAGPFILAGCRAST